MDYDVVIIGAGVVGLACAAVLSQKYSVIVLERHESFGKETSSRNSEVIHAGIYYKSGSLKAKLCVKGNKLLYDWCRDYKLPFRKAGKYISAVNPDEEEILESIYRQAQNNGVDGIHRITASNFNNVEPNVRASASLWSPSTGIVNSHLLMQSFENKAIANGCDFAYNHSVKEIVKKYGGYSIKVTDTENNYSIINSVFVINSAGLDSDTVAQSAGIDIDKEQYRLSYCRGHYFRIKPGKSSLVNHLIYPVPPADALSLGIHITLELDGQLKLGPDTMYMPDRFKDYSVPDELKDKFFSSVSRYLNGLEIDDITPDQSGIRPKLQKAGEPPRDFVIREESGNGLPGLINLIGIESPGLTASIAIAEYVYSLL